MWSGGTGGSGNNSQWGHNQWSFNANNYAHLPADQVDWAALAQQWIQMKDTQQHHHPVVQFPDPGPQLFLTPPFPNVPAPTPPFRIDNTPVAQADPWTTAIREQQNVVPDSIQIPLKEEWSTAESFQPSSEFNFQSGSFGHQEQLPSHHRHHHHHHHHQSEEYGEYWNEPTQPSSHVSGRKLPSHSKHEYNSHEQHDASRTTQELDAIRRKSLPAWIREGLEKVEREKRKKQEKEEQDALKAQLLEEQKSKFAKDSPENHLASKWTNPMEGNDAFDDDAVEEDKNPKTATNSETLKDKLRAFLIELNKEENFDQLMLCVRRQLTAILLDGTNDVMSKLAHEMLDKYKRKASQVKKTKAVASLKSELGTFGLTSYAGSDSDDSASDSVNDSSGGDTEEEISHEIEKRKKNFQYIQNVRYLGSDPRSPASSDGHGAENSDGTAGDNSKAQEKESSTSPSDRASTDGQELVVGDKSSQPVSDSKKEKPPKNVTRSLSPSSTERSRSRSVSRERGKRNKKSRSRSREKRRSKVSSSRDRKKSRKSKSRSKSRERKRSKASPSKSREKKRSKKSKSRSRSRERRRHKRSRSTSIDKKKSRKSHSRSKSRERERRNSKRSSSSDRKPTKRSRSASRSRKRSSKKSRSRSRERRASKRSRSRSRNLSNRRSASRSNSSERKEPKRSKSGERKRSSKKSKSRSKSRERKSGKSSKSRESKKSKKSRSRSKSSDKRSKYAK